MEIILYMMSVLPIFQTWLEFNFVKYSNFYDDILYLLLLIALILYMMLWKRKSLGTNINHYNRKLLRKAIRYYIAFIVCSIMFSLIQINLNNTGTYIGMIYELYKLLRNVVVIIVAYYVLKERQLIRMIKIYMFSCIIMNIAGIIEYLYGLKGYQLLKFIPTNANEGTSAQGYYNLYVAGGRIFGLLQHPNVYGEYMATGFFIIFYLTISKAFIYKNKKLQYLLIINSLLGVFISTSRMTLILVFVITIILAIKYRLYNSLRIIFGSAMLLTPFLLYSLVRLMDKLQMYSSGVQEGRVTYWIQAFHIFQGTLITGTGLGTWGDESAKYGNFISYKNIFYEINTLSDSYLSHLIVEHGIWIFLLLISVIYIIKILSNKQNNEDKCSGAISLITLSLFLFMLIASVKSYGFSLFENSYFTFLFIGYCLRKKIYG